jgi:type I restriction enzyme, S subunit
MTELDVARLDDVAVEYISGGTPSTKVQALWDGEIPWTTSAPINEGDIYLSTAQRNISAAALSSSATNLVPPNSVLVGTRVGVGKAVVNEIAIAISQDLTGIRLDSTRALPPFVVYQFKTARIQKYLVARARGTTIKGVSRFDLASTQLWLPSLEAQQSVVATLDSLKECIAARRRELALERERKAALMHHLFTHGTRGEPTKQTEIGEMPESWKIVQLGEISRIAYGLTVNQMRRNSLETAPYLTVANVTRGALRLDDVKTIGMLNGDAENYRLRAGDVLFVEGSGNPKLLGSAAIWNDELPFALHQNHLIRARPDRADVLPVWIMSYFNSNAGRSQLLGKATTSSGLHNINSRLVASLQLPLPEISEQHDIVGVYDTCDAYLGALARETRSLAELFAVMLEDLMTTGRLSADS